MTSKLQPYGVATVGGSGRQERLDLLDEKPPLASPQFNTAPAEKAGGGYGGVADEFGVTRKTSMEGAKAPPKVRSFTRTDV